MEKLVHGIHHITAIAGDPQKNVDFYTGVLGLRLVKKTVNFDAPNVYHLYYGDEKGTPGTILTFFPFPRVVKGKPGTGQATRIHFATNSNAIPFWRERLTKMDFNPEGPFESENGNFILFNDIDGLPLSIIGVDNDDRQGWSNREIPEDKALKGFYGVTLSIKEAQRTHDVLTGVLGHEKISQSGNVSLFGIKKGNPGSAIEVIEDPNAPEGKGGSGTIHHIAFGVPDNSSQEKLRDELQRALLHPTQVVDRQYFHSVYFREPGGVLFEIATDNPGFTIDEPPESLGQSLKLPEWEEPNRKFIEKGLPEITTPAKKGENETT